MKKILITGVTLSTLIVLLTLSGLYAKEPADGRLSTGQTLYVPAYSHIYSGNRENPFLLAVTLSIRNTDPDNAIEVARVAYYDTAGKLLKSYLEAPKPLQALESTRYIVPEKDKAGGSGANFIVEWKAAKPVNPPIVETIMIGARSSFTSRGQAIWPSK